MKVLAVILCQWGLRCEHAWRVCGIENVNVDADVDLGVADAILDLGGEALNAVLVEVAGG